MFEASRKSAGVAYLLWFFLGGTGAHRFYLGQSGTGACQLIFLVVGIVTSILVVGMFLLIALGIWVLVDAFLIPGLVQDYNLKLADRLLR
jgi:TM2 domain-containing membrane protein YozV